MSPLDQSRTVRINESPHSAGAAGSREWAAPLAGDYVVVDRSSDEAWIIDDPVIVRLTGGRLLATWTVRTRTNDRTRPLTYRCAMAHSDDDGANWRRIGELSAVSALAFIHGGDLLLMHHEQGRRNICLRRSNDEGLTWSDPITLFEGEFWNAPTAMATRNGMLYRALDAPVEGRSLSETRQSRVIAGDLDGDLMDPGAWRISPGVAYPGTPAGLSRGMYPFGQHPRVRVHDHWLEPNVVNVRGRLRVFHRTRIDGYATTSIAGICDLEDDGNAMTYRFAQFHPLPGAQNQFHILYDETTDLYWMTSNIPTDSQDVLGHGEELWKRRFKSGMGNERRMLLLFYSADALNWFQAGVIAMSANPLQSYHYTYPLPDGEDLLILSRTSVNAPNQHDSDTVTFHRVRRFRRLAVNLQADIPD